MKGRRKVKTLKWFIKSQLQAEANLVATKKSANQAQFLSAASRVGRESEPVGVMAGSLKAYRGGILSRASQNV